MPGSKIEGPAILGSVVPVVAVACRAAGVIDNNTFVSIMLSQAAALVGLKHFLRGKFQIQLLHVAFATVGICLTVATLLLVLWRAVDTINVLSRSPVVQAQWYMRVNTVSTQATLPVLLGLLGLIAALWVKHRRQSRQMEDISRLVKSSVESMTELEIGEGRRGR